MSAKEIAELVIRLDLPQQKLINIRRDRLMKLAHAVLATEPVYNRPHDFKQSDAILVTECTACGRSEGDTIHDLSDETLTEERAWARNSGEDL